MISALEFRRNNLVGLSGCYCKGYESRRNVYALKASAHRVLSADCRASKVYLRLECSEQSREGLAPTLGILTELLEVFLEREIYVTTLSACCYELCYALNYCEICAVIRALFCNVGICAPRHIRYGVCVRFFNRDEIYHCLRRCELMLSAERHKHSAGANGRVESFAKTALGAHVEICYELLVSLREALGNALAEGLGLFCFYVNVLFSTVGI